MHRLFDFLSLFGSVTILTNMLWIKRDIIFEGMKGYRILKKIMTYYSNGRRCRNRARKHLMSKQAISLIIDRIGMSKVIAIIYEHTVFML